MEATKGVGGCEITDVPLVSFYVPTASSPFQRPHRTPLLPDLAPVIVIPNPAAGTPGPPTEMWNPARHRRRHPLLCALLFVSIAASAASAARGPIAFATITTKTAPIATAGAAAEIDSLSSTPPATTGRSARRVPITASSTGPTAFATVSARPKAAAAQQYANAASADSPFSAKAALIRYWTRKIPNGQPKPAFLLSKASPLSAADAALYERLAAQPGGLTARLRAFCSAAALCCFPDLAPTLDRQGGSANFAGYSSKDFSNYGTGTAGGLDSFKNYSENENVPIDSFRRYSRGSAGHADRFTRYAPNGNVVTANFTSYATGAVGGSGDFTSYDSNSNVPDLKFANYDADANGRVQSFNSYSDDTNAGDQSFTGYGKRGLGIPLAFKSYGTNSNVIGSTFRNYGEEATSANDTFANYGFNGNVPKNTFSSYGDGGHAASESFSSYRDQSNVGDDSFTSYAKESTGSASASFARYGQSFNLGSDTFTGYGEDAVGKPSIDFKTYGFNNTFKDYDDKKSVSFQEYNVSATSSAATTTASAEGGGAKRTTNRWVEPGRFFRESMLKPGTVMPMPDIRDRMPRRAFLPRSIAEKLPFSTSRLGELNQVFNATTDSALGKAMSDTVAECERAPSRGETKRCATSAEGMIDFATSVLGENVVVRSTEGTAGSGGSVVVGAVRGVDGGRVTRSVSCHQSLFPYLVYYCHSVPKVRVYEADIHEAAAAGAPGKVNRGVAICHLDTADWSAGHGAFVALGSGPGKIEVCHWIFQGDMTWTVAD